MVDKHTELRGDPPRHRPHRGPAGRAATQGFRTIQVTRAAHPYAGAWWPDGHTIGYEHTFTHEVRDLLHAIADGRDPVPSFADGLQVQEVLDAVQRSAAAGAGWTKVGQ
jgi:predicted dehydrogenase